MERNALPRGLVGRSLIAAMLFAVTVVPGWTLGDLVERWTGWGLLDWLVTCSWFGLVVRVLGPRASYRRRDGWLGALPLYGWYLTCVLCWRVALLPYRDWEPRPDELWQARWLTGDLLGLWRADQDPDQDYDPDADFDEDPGPVPRAAGVRAGTGPAAGRRTR